MIGEHFARTRAPMAKAKEAGEAVAERGGLLQLGLFGVLSAAIYYLALTRPYGLARLWMAHQLDLDRLGATDPAARWFILGGLIAAGLLYVMAWRTIRRLQTASASTRRLAWGIVIASALASAAVLLFFYPLGSTDIWDYIMHGRMLGLYNANPFSQVAAQFPQDKFSWYTGWPYDTSAYGPFWEVLAALAAKVAGSGVIENVVAFKVLVGLFLAASIGTVTVILRRVAPEKALTGALLLAWNPVVLYETIANGHNDIVMMFWVLVAAHMLLDRRYTFAILSLVAGALVKFIPVLFIPAAGLIALRELPTWRVRIGFLLVTAAASILLIVMAYQPFWVGVQTLGMERRQEMYISSIPAAVVALTFPQIGWIEATHGVAKYAGLLTGFFAMAEAFRAWYDRSPESFVRSVFDISMFYLMVACLWFWPWYAIWPLALLPLLPPGHLPRLAQIFGVAALSKALIWNPLLTWDQSPLHDWIWQQVRLGPAVMALPLAYSLYAIFESGLTRIQVRLLPQREAPEPVYVEAGDR